jgi:CRP-like cAMP-binding protein
MTSAITTLDEAKSTLDDLAKRMRSAARLTRPELMSTLSKIYAVRLSEADRLALLDYVVEQRRIEGANRAFLLRSSNEFMLPLRYVFPGLADRTNISRYAGALTELRKTEVEPGHFHQEVKKRGGLIELYWNGRGRGAKRQVRSKLSLDRNIEAVSGKEILLRLLPQPSGVFKVLEATQQP